MKLKNEGLERNMQGWDFIFESLKGCHWILTGCGLHSGQTPLAAVQAMSWGTGSHSKAAVVSQETGPEGQNGGSNSGEKWTHGELLRPQNQQTWRTGHLRESILTRRVRGERVWGWRWGRRVQVGISQAKAACGTAELWRYMSRQMDVQV